MDDYQFDDITGLDSGHPVTPSTSPSPSSSSFAGTGGDYQGQAQGGGQGQYADELYTKQIKAKFRTFFVDLKQSQNGKFVKISEKSNGRKSTIMMDGEDVPALIEALQEIQQQL